MSDALIRAAIEKTSGTLVSNPDKGRVKNVEATASLLDGLRCEVKGTSGELLQTDMPRAVGGTASAPNPGWLMRAALASCNATCIAIRAAKLGVPLTTLEVTVSSESDLRGMLGVGDMVPAGLQELCVTVRIAAPGHATETLDELVRWACAHSPVGGSDPATARVIVQVQA
jgi:uncharacterized OsmC-like protein